MLKKTTLCLLALSLILSACATTANDHATTTTLADYQWALHDAQSSDGQRIDGLFARPDAPLTLSIHGNTLSIVNGCNQIGADVTITGQQLSVSNVRSTMMACVDPALERADRLISDYLQGKHNISLSTAGEPATLTLSNASATSIWQGQLTPEARYGEGETIFLAVAPQTTPCTSGVMGHDCLQVREVHYDADGIKHESDADWQTLHTPIEGYTHQDGVAEIIRLKRYQRPEAPADAGDTVYVYEMTVESTLAE